MMRGLVLVALLMALTLSASTFSYMCMGEAADCRFVGVCAFNISLVRNEVYMVANHVSQFMKPFCINNGVETLYMAPTHLF